MHILKFSAEWCGPCKMLSKTLESTELKYPIQEVDIDDPDNSELIKRHNIRSVPTLVLVDNLGNGITSATGSLTKQDLVKHFGT